MSPDAMSVRLHLRRVRVIAVVVDLIERLVVEMMMSAGWFTPSLWVQDRPGA